MSRPALRSRRSLEWSAAAVTAAALYALPWTLLVALSAVGWWLVLLLANVAALVWIAVRLWSPVVVLGATILSIGGAAAFSVITAAGETCGGSHLADALSWIGAVALALLIGAWGVRRGFWTYGAVVVGWLVAGAWFVLVAHLVHGGTGACFD